MVRKSLLSVLFSTSMIFAPMAQAFDHCGCPECPEVSHDCDDCDCCDD